MSFFLQPSPIEYLCTCGLLVPITKLYFCRHCLELRCGQCVCIEVDSHFCSNCLENIPSSEAKHKKNKCNNCFDCPSCHHTLSARGTTINVVKKSDEEGGAEKTVPKKMYYLACLACRWTSRDAGIPDQTVATGSWPEPENIHATRFQILVEYSQTLVQRKKQEKLDYSRRKSHKQSKFPSLTDRTGLTMSMIRRQMNWSEKLPPKPQVQEIQKSVATDEVDELPDFIFKQAPNLNSITTITQRLAQTSMQPDHVSKLYPQHKSLCIKRSLRCKKCEHNVMKPELNPNSIKYRIQLFAVLHVPEVRLFSCETLKAGEKSTLRLKFVNPTIHDTKITLLEWMRAENEFVEGRVLKLKRSGEIELPEEGFEVIHRDDSADLDEDQIKYEREEPTFISWRKGNQVIVDLKVQPDEALKSGEAVLVGFAMKYTYTSMATGTPEKREPQKHELIAKVCVKVGEIV